MSLIHKLILLLIGVTSVPVGYVFYSAALSSRPMRAVMAPRAPRWRWTAAADPRRWRLLGGAKIPAQSQLKCISCGLGGQCIGGAHGTSFGSHPPRKNAPVASRGVRPCAVTASKPPTRT
jgi:hypothetical protein